MVRAGESMARTLLGLNGWPRRRRLLIASTVDAGRSWESSSRWRQEVRFWHFADIDAGYGHVRSWRVKRTSLVGGLRWHTERGGRRGKVAVTLPVRRRRGMAVELNGQQDVYPLTSRRKSVILARVRDCEVMIGQDGQPWPNGRNPKTPPNWMLANLQGVTPIGKPLLLRTAKPKRPHVTGPLPIQFWTVCAERLKASLTVVALGACG
jgi:hypothetical protein